MEPHINNILEPNETIVWQGAVNRKVMITFLSVFLVVTFLIGGFLFSQETINFTSGGKPKMISGSIVAIVVMIVGLIMALISFLSDLVKAYAITQKRIVIKSGLIGTDFRSIYFDQIKQVIVDVGLIGKIFSTGTVKIDTGKTETYSTGGGRGGGRSGVGQIRTRTMYDNLKHVDSPYEVYKYVQQTLEGRKERLYSGRADAESNPEAPQERSEQ